MITSLAQLDWPFLALRNAKPYIIGSKVDGVRICRTRDGNREIEVPRCQLFEQSDLTSPIIAPLKEAVAGWVRQDGSSGIYERHHDVNCWGVTTTHLLPDERNIAEMVLPFAGGTALVEHTAPGILHVHMDGARPQLFSMTGNIQMLRPVFDDPASILFDVTELPGVAQIISARMVRRRTYMLRTYDMAFYRVETEPLAISTSLLLDRGLAVSRLCSTGPRGTLVDCRNVLLTSFRLVAASPNWVQPRAKSENAAARASAVATVKATQQGKSNDRTLIAQFFDDSLPCNFEGCERLRAKYKADVAAAGGDECPSCVLDSIKSKMTLMVREQLHALESAAKDAS